MPTIITANDLTLTVASLLALCIVAVAGGVLTERK